MPPAIGHSDTLLDVPGGRVFVRRWPPAGGNAGAAPIVLLHDSLGCVELWRDFPERLAQATAREVVAYDRLGFGRSTPRTDAPRLDFIADEAATSFPAIRAELGFERCVLFGHSVGGSMALAMAAAHPRHVDAVISESAQAFVEPRTLDGIRAAVAEFAAPEQLERLVRRHGARARWVLDAWAVWLSPRFHSWNLDAELAAVACPLLAIHGDADEFGSCAFPQRIVERVAGASQLAILEGCGHVPHRERPDEVLSLAAAFLRNA